MSAENAAVAVVGTLDTKAQELGFVKQRIEDRGVSTILIDVGILGEPGIEPDISADEVAKAAGSSIAELRSGEKADAIGGISKGAAATVRRLYDEGRIGGAIAVGGGQGTTIASGALRSLPVGVPKLLVSTIVSIPGVGGDVFGTRDVTAMNSVIDISGLNSISRGVLANAADAIAGMVTGPPLPAEENPPLRVTTTMFGVTTKGVNGVRERLEQAGVELLVFAATGVGDRAMEDLIAEGGIDGVVDFTTSQVGQAVVLKRSNAGPKRLEVAGEAGLPQVIAPGGLDILNLRKGDPLLEECKAGTRKSIAHNPILTVARPTAQESGQIGKELARKLNAARGPVTVVLPLKGISDYSAEGGPLHDPEADKALFDALREDLDDSIKVVELDCAINDPRFAEEVATQFLALVAPDRAGQPVS